MPPVRLAPAPTGNKGVSIRPAVSIGYQPQEPGPLPLHAVAHLATAGQTPVVDPGLLVLNDALQLFASGSGPPSPAQSLGYASPSRNGSPYVLYNFAYPDSPGMHHGHYGYPSPIPVPPMATLPPAVGVAQNVAVRTPTGASGGVAVHTTNGAASEQSPNKSAPNSVSAIPTAQPHRDYQGHTPVRDTRTKTLPHGHVQKRTSKQRTPPTKSPGHNKKSPAHNVNRAQAVAGNTNGGTRKVPGPPVTPLKKQVPSPSQTGHPSASNTRTPNHGTTASTNTAAVKHPAPA